MLRAGLDLSQGSADPLPVTLEGNVIGPTFHFDVEELTFKDISVGFLQSRMAWLINTSDIPLRFSLRIPEDGVLVNREFDIIPATGTVLPLGKQRIQVDILPASVRKYKAHLVVDIEGVGRDLLSIPVHARSIVPAVCHITCYYFPNPESVGQ